MSKVKIEQKIFEMFPDLKVGIIKCSKINNKIINKDQYLDLLQTSASIGIKLLTNSDFSKNSVISVWRDAYKKFKTKKGARASIEALLKRVSNGNMIGSINPLVDIYNSVSLKYGMPCGGEDTDAIDGDLILTFANGTESFQTIGSDENNPPYEGEIIYKDNEGAVCRCWNWREAQRTMLVEKTTNAILCIELIDSTREEEFKEALNELLLLVNDNLGGQNSISILDKNNNEIEL